jgi:hypothetical protein
MRVQLAVNGRRNGYWNEVAMLGNQEELRKQSYFWAVQKQKQREGSSGRSNFAPTIN